MTVTEVQIAYTAVTQNSMQMRPPGTGLDVAWTDNDDNTYGCQFGAGTYRNILALADYTVPSGKFVGGWKVHSRYEGVYGSIQYMLQRGTWRRGAGLIPTTVYTPQYVKTFANVAVGSPNEDDLAGIVPLLPVTIDQITGSPDSGPGALLNKMGIVVDCINSSNDSISNPPKYRVLLLKVFYEVVDMPTVTVPLPSGNYTDTVRPLIQGIYSQPDGYGAGKYQVRVFTQAQYSASGFDPGLASSPVWEIVSNGISNITAGVVASNDMPQNTNLKAFVRFAITSTGTDIWTPWTASAVYTCNVEAPATPLSVAATADPSNGRINVIAKAGLNLLSVADSTLEPSIGSWVSGNGSTTVSRGTSPVIELGEVLHLHATASAQLEADTGFYPVAPNTAYSLSMTAQAGSTGRTCRLRVSWYDSTSTLISNAEGTMVDSSSGPLGLNLVNQVSPTNAAFAKVKILVDSAASGEDHYFDKIGLFTGATFAGWTRGGFLTNAPSGITPATWILERSFDNGLTWESVSIPLSSQLVESTQQTLNIEDYTVPWGQNVLYRVSIQGYDYNSNNPVTTSTLAMTIPSQLPLQANGGFWLKCPSDPSFNMTCDIMNQTFKHQMVEQQAVYYALGREDPIVVSDVINFETLPGVMFETIDEAPYLQLLALHALQTTMLLQDSKTGLQWYVRFGSPFQVEEFNTTPRQRANTVDLIAVGQP